MDISESWVKQLEQELEEIRDKMIVDSSLNETHVNEMEEENSDLKNQIE